MQYSNVILVALVLWDALLQPIHGAEEGYAQQVTEEESEETTNYRPPERKQHPGGNTIPERIVNRYRATLSPPTDLRSFIAEEMGFLVEGRDDIVLDLTDDLDKLKDMVVIVKEGAQYQIRLRFKVHHESITGLSYEQSLTRNGVVVDKETSTVGTYVPMTDQQTWVSVAKQAPQGIFARGKYNIRSKIYDENEVYLQWDWQMDVKKDWN